MGCVVVDHDENITERKLNDQFLDDNEMKMKEEKEEEEEEVVLVFPPLSNESIREAVRLWRHDQAQATEKYGPINKWNTSQVTHMSQLFKNYGNFNDNISEWDVSNVTNMSHMFHCAYSFNQDVSEWDVSSVTNMRSMFYCASFFNQDVSEWNVSNVTIMGRMFYGASSFDKDVGCWDVSKVTDMSFMFSHASSFNQDVSKWDVSDVTILTCMFFDALSFNQDISAWDILSREASVHMMISGTKVEMALSEFCGVECFFDADCGAMSRKERQELFSVAFPWGRRKSFVLFLVCQGYIYCSSVRPIDGNRSRFEETCDILFDIEDLDREICKFL